MGPLISKDRLGKTISVGQHKIFLCKKVHGIYKFDTLKYRKFEGDKIHVYCKKVMKQNKKECY